MRCRPLGRWPDIIGRPAVLERDLAAKDALAAEVREPPTTLTTTRHDGPNHLGL